MKLSTTRELYDYWDRSRGDRLAPDRDDIEPGAIRACLGNTFIVAFDPDGDHPFRLAGTAICALFGRELKGSRFLDLWSPDSRDAVIQLAGTICEETAGAVAGVTGTNADGETVVLEMMVLPLGCRDRTPERLLGSLAPTTTPYWLGTRPIETLSIGDLRYVGPAIDSVAPPRFSSGQDNPLTGCGFTVYQGGRPD